MQKEKPIKYKVKLVTVAEGAQKAPLSIATTSRCRGRRYPIPWIVPLFVDPYLIVLSAEQGDIKYHF